MGINNSKRNTRITPSTIDDESTEVSLSTKVTEEPMQNLPKTELLDESIQYITPSTTDLNSTRKMPPLSIATKLVIVWLDANVNDPKDVYQNSLARLQHIATSIQTFTDIENCLKFLNEKQTERILMVISNEFLPEIWPKIQSMTNIHSVYIISSGGEEKSIIDDNSSKVKGIFTNIDPLCGSVKRDNIFYRQDTLTMSIIPSNRYDKNNLKEINPLFLYWMLVKQIIRDLKYNPEAHKSEKDPDRREKEIQRIEKIAKNRMIRNFLHTCSNHYLSDPTQLKIIKEFERTYHQYSPIWWYTRNCFISSMLNKAFQTRDIELIMRMSFFIKDLMQEIEKIQATTRKKVELPVISYRIQQISDEDFQTMNDIKGCFLSFNNFVFGDPDYEASLDVIRKMEKHKTMVILLFSMKVGSERTLSSYASLHDLRISSDNGKLIIFSMHSIFRVIEIKQIDKQVYQIDLILATYDDENILFLAQTLRNETRTYLSWFKLAHILSIVQDYDQAREIYYTLLQVNKHNPLKTARIYNELGLIDDARGDYASALVFYQKALQIREKQLPPNDRSLIIAHNNIAEIQRQLGNYVGALTNHQKTLRLKRKAFSPHDLSLATTYNNIALANESLAEYSTAVRFYQKALELKQKVLPFDHIELAVTYNNIGELNRLMGNFQDALTNFEQALRIRLRKRLPNDSSLAVLYNNLGLIHRELGNYTTALSYFQKSIDVKTETLQSDHPSNAFSYNNMGDLHQQLGDYAKALSYYKKALDIQVKAFAGNHPDIAITYVNMGDAYQAMAHFKESQEFYEKALQVRLKALPPHHPLLGTCYNNIGHVNQLMGQYNTALDYYNKTLKIQEKTLQRYHPAIATTYNNLADVNQKLDNLNKALIFHQKSLEIKKKSLPPDHPSLIITYNNIGVINQSMKNYPDALNYYKLTLETQKKSLSSDHPDLAAIYNNLGVTYQSMKEYDNAHSYYQKALEIQEKHLRLDHPDIAITYNSLATVLVSLGDFSKALEYEQRAIDIASKTLSDDHPHLIIFRDYHTRIAAFIEATQ